MSKWVQHISGKGAKWELSCDAAQASNNKQDHWRVPFEKYGLNFLPKSEYVECSPPEPEWVDVTQSCESGQSLDAYGRDSMLCKDEHGWIVDIFSSCQRQDYRLIKTDGGFRVERKVK